MKVPIPSTLGQVKPANVPLRYSGLAPSGSAFGGAVAEGLGALGAALNVRAESLTTNRNQENRIKANGDMIAFQLEQDRTLDALSRNKAPFSAIDEGYAVQYYAKADEILKNAPDQDTREYLQNELVNLYGNKQLEAQGLERTRNSDATKFSLQTQLDTAQSILQSDPTQLDEQAEKLTTAFNAAEGVIPIDDLRARIRAALQGVVVSSAEGRIKENPRLMLEELNLGTLKSGGTADLIYRESGGDPSIVNSAGFAGLYQFGAPRLADLGVYTPAKNENLRDWEGTWDGTFNIPGFPNVKTLGDFLATPEAQHEAFKLHEAKMDQEIADNGFDKYVGQTVNGVLITTQGLHNMLHLGGVGGTRKALKGETVTDSNGTSVLDYAKMGSGIVDAAGGINAILTGDQKGQLINLAEATIKQQQAERDKSEDDAWQNLQRQQTLNYTTIQAGVARGEVTEPQLVTAVSRNLISGEQFRTLRDDLRHEQADGGDPEAALEIRNQIYRGEPVTSDQIMARRDIDVTQRKALLDLLDESARRGGVLARADVKTELDRLESIVGGNKTAWGSYEDSNAAERVANALQEARDRIYNKPDEARKIVDEVGTRYRPDQRLLTTLPNIPFWTGPKVGPKKVLQQQVGETSGRIEQAHKDNLLDEVSYLQMLKDLERYSDAIDAMTERAVPNATSE